MIAYQHYPVIIVMGLFLAAFLIEIFGSRNRVIRGILAVGSLGASLVMLLLLVPHVLFKGEVISYWMGNWEPVAGYAIGIGYEVDGLGLVFALVCCMVAFLSCIYALEYLKHDEHKGHYYTLYLMLTGAVLGMTMTGDIFNMFIMIEIICFSGSALIAFRNWDEGALEGALKYFMMDSVGSKLVLLGVALLYLQAHTLNMAQLASYLHSHMTPVSVLAFAVLFGGFAVKAFIMPCHTPVAEGHTMAPASISMMLSCAVMKTGVYGMIRLLYVLFRSIDLPSVQVLVTAFGCLTMFGGAVMALCQSRLKRLLAFSSISQIGYVITAVGTYSAIGMTGALFHVFNHSLFKGIAFLCAGTVIHATGYNDMDKMGGLARKMPRTMICFLVSAMAIAGLPPFNGFVSKWMIYQAIYEKGIESGNFWYIFVCVVAVATSSITLAYFLKPLQSVFFGQLPADCKDAADPPFLMRLPVTVMAALCLIAGVFYKPFVQYILTPAVNSIFNITKYIDSMMGEGYSAAAGFTDVEVAPAQFHYWDPVMWLVLFVVILAGVIVFLAATGKSRGTVLQAASEENEKYAVFFSGEKSEYSHVTGTDLFWGFRKAMSGFITWIRGMHTGSINDYASWIVWASAIVIVYMFAFVFRGGV